MSVSAIGLIGRRATAYALSSPYLNGVRRMSDSDTAAAARLQASAAAMRVRQSAAPGRALPVKAAPAMPFANPAIPLIAQQAAISAMLTAPGTSSTLEQSYVAAALLTGAMSPVFSGIHIAPGTPDVPPVAALARAAKPA